ncbi:GNAT family N-acetyltransferase [uncultured Prevotella sp.]|uniref:GNAT family N-acetyltransferase n=1 Tax=uncultured Prevotella sp. TaxID=159272 RepID=UPI00260C6242|nr:GNAT family N-acetyltransferase [uncultured Prevotella sp.]
MGIDGQKVEMLFVSPCYFSQGLGSQLMNTAIREYHVCNVDVNEQNTKALGFYLNLGFRVFERKETDEQGNSFPILRMKLVADNV